MSAPVMDVNGQRFGKLVVLRRSGSYKGGQATWECQCDCGSPPVIRRSSLLRNSAGRQSCGCTYVPKSRPHDDLTGTQFARLLVEGEDRLTGRLRWRCRCDCGEEIFASRSELVHGKTQSCGCFQRQRLSETKSTHGHGRRNARSPEYRSWVMMHARCSNKNIPTWKDYGGRGIAVCDRWKDFSAFLRDMGPRPEGATLDRYPDNDGNYEPGNCRWATKSEQAFNRRPKHGKGITPPPREQEQERDR